LHKMCIYLHAMHRVTAVCYILGIQYLVNETSVGIICFPLLFNVQYVIELPEKPRMLELFLEYFLHIGYFQKFKWSQRAPMRLFIDILT